MKRLYAKGNLVVLDFKNYLKGQRGDSEFNDGGSSNWTRNMAIGFALGAVLLALVKGFMPTMVDAWKAKVMEWFN